MSDLHKIIAQQQRVIDTLLRVVHGSRKAPPEGCKELYPLETRFADITFDVRKRRIIYHILESGLKLAKHYRTIHAMRIIHGRIARDPDGPYMRECIAQAHFGYFKPTKTNYPL